MNAKSPMFKQFLFGNLVVDNKPLSAAEIEKIILSAALLKETPPPQDKILDIFSRLSKAWANPSYPRRKEAHSALLKSTGLSTEFIETVLNEFPKMLDPESFLKKMEGELGSRLIQEEPVLQPSTGMRLIAAPAGLVLHVAAGNVFLGGVDSLTDGIITKNINFLKMSTDDREFPVIFAESIKEFDREGIITKRLAILWWKGGDIELENIFKKSMDRIVFWGGADALSNWEGGLGAQTVLVRHGPKTSFGIISKTGLKNANISDLTDRIALDIAIWEQKACSCPQALFMEESILKDQMKPFMDSLTGSMRRAGSHFPPSKRSDDECVEVLRARELAMAGHFVSGEPVKVLGPDTLDWTIINEEDAKKEDFISSPLNRTIIVRRYSSIRALAKIFKGRAFYLQTAGYCLGDSEISEYAKFLSSSGVTRMCPFGIMSIPTPGAPHDGTYPLRDLVRYTVVESGSTT